MSASLQVPCRMRSKLPETSVSCMTSTCPTELPLTSELIPEFNEAEGEATGELDLPRQTRFAKQAHTGFKHAAANFSTSSVKACLHRRKDMTRAPMPIMKLKKADAIGTKRFGFTTIPNISQHAAVTKQTHRAT